MMAPAPTIQPASTGPLTDTEKLPGTWKLISCFMEDAETRDRKEIWGAHPNGHLILTAGGYWAVVQTAEKRKAPQLDEDHAAAFRSMLAYSGRYRIDGRKVVINVEVAWDESWVGTEQVRCFSIEDDRLHIEATPQRYPNLDDRVMRALLVWERLE